LGSTRRSRSSTASSRRSSARPIDGRLRVVLVAEESAGAQVLEALLAAPESPEIAAVVTSIEADGLRRPVVAAAAARAELDVRPAAELRSAAFADSLHALDTDLLLNVHSLSVLDAHAIGAPRIGAFNLHPGPLPEYAGLNAPSWAIYEGRTTHEATLHWMDVGIDTGAVAYRASFPIDHTETGLSLTAKCVRHGVPLVLRLIADAARDPTSIPALAQDPRKRRYFGREIPNGGNIEWDAPAREVVRFVRAADYSPFASPWGTPQAQLSRRPVGITRASLTGEATHEPPGSAGRVLDDGAVLVATADEWIAVRRMHVEGRSVAPRKVLSPGDRFALGTRHY
jgi:methionyl-tRNA formyltransferase